MGVPDSLRDSLADRYALDRELGRGGMATVYLARDLKHDRAVALKAMHPEIRATLGAERFQQEIRLAAGLQHPHILTVHDSGEAGGHLWFTMPYVEGQSLRDRLRREIQLPVAEAVRIATEVSRALTYAHRHGIIHRDIKPENILLTPEGETLVADFGIARAVEDAAGQERLTETGIVVGTPAYMSPEQASGQRNLDARTDVYSLGTVLYEMLAGEPPYTGPTAQTIVAKRLSDPVPSVRRLRPAVPEALDRLVRDALAPLPADRLASAAAFQTGLEAIPAASAETTAAPLRSPVASRWRTLAIGAAGVLVVAAAIAVAARRARTTTASSVVTSASTATVAPAEPMLAVLPFENLGDSSNAYFADGVADAVRGKLVRLPGLGVIARGSSLQFRHTSASPDSVARVLGVRYLLMGTVRWAKAKDGIARVEVSPELVEVRPGAPAASRWQQPFDAALTDVFQVQADIATRVAEALDLALTRPVQQELAEQPTRDLAAYDAYLKGEAVSQGMGVRDVPTLLRADSLYARAVAGDSGFGLAWARLATGHVLVYYNGVPDPAEADAARRALARAEALAPTAPETFLARVTYEAGIPFDNVAALAAAERGLARTPDSPELLVAAALAERGLGRWDAALGHLERAKLFDPRSFAVAERLGRVLAFQRRWERARVELDRALSLAPTALNAIDLKVFTYLGEGDTAGARRTIAAAAPLVGRQTLAAFLASVGDLYWALDRDDQRLVLSLGPEAFNGDRASWGMTLAQIHHLFGDSAEARAYADSARTALEAQLRAAPNDAQRHAMLGLALAYLGRLSQGIREGERGVALMPVSKDAHFGPYLQHVLVNTYIVAGRHEQALDGIERLLEIPYILSPGLLRVDPTFAPLRANPRFRRLVEGAAR
jgi:eukaryotic-like serine/threonine-protein kinase